MNIDYKASVLDMLYQYGKKFAESKELTYAETFKVFELLDTALYKGQFSEEVYKLMYHRMISNDN